MTKLIVEPKTARLFRDTDTFGKMDPYVTLNCGSEKKKTKTHHSGGKNPSWTDCLNIKCTDTTLTITVWDEDVGSDDFVGCGTVDVSSVVASGGYKDWIKIYHKGKEAGEVYLEITPVSGKTKDAFYSSTMPMYAPAPAPTPTYTTPSYAAPTYATPSYTTPAYT
eukprot:CAMPEP_0168354706 /NCGR_PEP_ID=MMETSP0213-20121227/24068_1 /TAXON_ID=151035 /ORGANISM="Euplotes harpa, Strain FSP1.4" /LENGTH=164 /DNA_ID=CAMNT_0008366683 /DNA_START=13 /DNA_END=504 /DNA_ORIENTATION=-